MDQSATIQRLTKQLKRIELEIIDIQRELQNIPESQMNLTPTIEPVTHPLMDKVALEEKMRELFSKWGIRGEPIGALELQKLMGEAGLAPNELSQSIISSREN